MWIVHRVKLMCAQGWCVLALSVGCVRPYVGAGVWVLLTLVVPVCEGVVCLCCGLFHTKFMGGWGQGNVMLALVVVPL